MKTHLLLLTLVFATTQDAPGAQTASIPASPSLPAPGEGAQLPTHSLKLVEEHCADCHEGKDAKGGFDITALGGGLGSPALRDSWTRVFDAVESQQMPPPEKSQLQSEERRSFVALLGNKLETESRAEVARNGRGPVRRLTRAEFENNLRLILELPDLDVRDRLPADRDAHGFTKVSALLDVSRVQVDAYLDATEAALRLAMAPAQPPAPAVTQTFTGTDLFPSISTYGGAEAMFFARNNRRVPIQSAEYDKLTPEARKDPSLELALFRAANWPYFGYPRGFRAKATGAYKVRFNARAVRQVRDFRLVPGSDTQPLALRARLPSGPCVLLSVRETGGWIDIHPEPREYETTVFLNQGETIEWSPLGLPSPFIRTDGGRFFYDYPPMPREGHRGVALQKLEITGPLRDSAWPPASHKVLFDSVDPKKGTPEDAIRLFKRFAQRAALRPMPPEALEPFEKLIQSKLNEGIPFADALFAGYQALLCSSHCIYLTEPRGGTPDHAFAVANRLSHFLWNSRPDTELEALAKDGRLLDPAVLAAQTRRMIQDPRFLDFVRVFAEEWLDLKKLRRDLPDERLYPEYRKDDYLVDSMEKETLEFLREMIRENLPVSTLVKADFTFVNDRLALHYDLPPVAGAQIRRVKLPPESPYGGILTQASILKHTANGTSTSPVLRGAWVMEKIIGQAPPPPPKNVPAIEPDIRGAKTIRDQLAKHTAEKSCSSCHAKFDSVGFALENFDVMGAWRDRYRGMEKGDQITGVDPAGHPYSYFVGALVDASGKLPGGAAFQDINELKSLFAEAPRQLARGLLKHLTLHATGTPVGFADRAGIDSILDASAAEGFRVADLISRLIQSPVFLGTPNQP
jgi:mono/diheme cytochrome c family protein